MSDQQKPVQLAFRQKVAVWTIVMAGLALTVAIIAALTSNSINALTVFTAVVGLSGTWIGTVLSFYFGQENMEAASRESRQNLREARQAHHEAGIVVLGDIMVSFSSLPKREVDNREAAGKMSIHELNEALEPKLGVLLIIEKNSLKTLYLVHRLVLDQFLLKETDAANKKLGDLAAHDEFKDRISTEIMEFMAPSDTVAEAKGRLLTARDNIWDIVVTDNGTADGAVVGWVPDHKLRSL